MKRAWLVAAVAAVLAMAVATTASAEIDTVHGWDYRVLSVDAGMVPIRGAFVGDSTTDILWYRPGPGRDTLWTGTAGARGGASFGRVVLTITGIYTPIVGDFAGDWHSDILWYAPGSAPDYLWVASGDAASPFTSVAMPISGRYTAVSLYDSAREDDGFDGKDDIVFYADGAAKDYLWHFDDAGSGSHSTIPLILNRPFKLLAGDWNGDFRADLLLYAPGTAKDLQWFFAADGSHTAKDGPRLDGTTYQPVRIPQRDFDSALLWRSGPDTDAYFQGTASGLAQRGLRQGGWSGVPTGVNGGAVITTPDPVDIWFDAPDAPGDFYDLQTAKHNVATDTMAIPGDFDADGWVDLVWYGGKDQLWYSYVPPAGAEARSLRADGDRSLPQGPPR